MMRISFRQSMLAGFLLIALLLSWAALRSWLTLEQFVEQSRRGSEQALQLSASIQELADRAVDLERNTRQFMVLEDAGLLERFDENVTQSQKAIKRLEAIPGEALGDLPERWRLTIESLSQGIHRIGPRVDLVPFLVTLAEINSGLDHQGRRWIEERHATMLDELEQNRVHLMRVLIAAISGALFVALVMGWWLSRPIVNLERSIERLGDSRFDQPVTVGGPADLRRVGRRLDWLRRRLGQLESERERTLRHVSHELKTPLTALREGTALLQEEVVGALDGAQKEVVDILHHNVMALQKHIESLLRLNATSFEARRLSYRPVALAEVLADVVRGRDLQIQARQLSIVCDAPRVTRSLDGEKLLVMLDNLLSNAIDFSPTNGVIRLHADVLDNLTSFTCSDQGPGVAAKDAERIFEPFVQGERPPPEPRQGSGVGLSIVRELVTAMGGKVQLMPGHGRNSGATFRIEVPCEF
ncbi:MAG: HAMP domain-containing sensor histidine kinase [Propionivibrio sp.]